MSSQHPVPTLPQTNLTLLNVLAFSQLLINNLCNHSDPDIDIFDFSIHFKSLPKIRSGFSLKDSVIAFFLITQFLILLQILMLCSRFRGHLNHVHWMYGSPKHPIVENMLPKVLKDTTHITMTMLKIYIYYVSMTKTVYFLKVFCYLHHVSFVIKWIDISLTI